jgi:hypothetical protein
VSFIINQVLKNINNYGSPCPPEVVVIATAQLAELTGKTRHAIESWLSLHKIRPLSEALYPPYALVKIQEASRGRPKKPNEPAEPDKTDRKARKQP